MSISNTIQSIENHIDKAYKGLKNLGADLTGVNKNINNISTVLDTIYDNSPKVSDEGTDLALSPTREGKLKIIPKGNTEQDSYKGYQLLPNLTDTTFSSNGVNYTVKDNEIKISGTATSSSNLQINFNEITLPSTLFVYLFNNFSNNDIVCNFRRGTTVISSIIYASNNRIVQSSTLVGQIIDNVLITVANGVTVNGTTKLMLASQNNLDYEPFVGRTSKSKSRLSTRYKSCKWRE